MILIDWTGASRRRPGVALLFGSGLLGGAVLHRLITKTLAPARRLRWDWSSTGADDVRAAERATLEALSATPRADLAIIWAAGQSGFGSDAKVMGRETEALKTVMATAKRLGTARPETNRSFHLVSSAGGLFEGQVACGPDAEPCPLRPYGAEKHAQERLVAADEALGLRRIYRPSSVYGYAPAGRRNLISALTTAALQRRMARIIGALTTQRDYVLASDIGNFIADCAVDPGPAAIETHLLASGRPAAIFEIIHLVEARIGATLLLQIDPNPINARDNTFLPSALPQRLRPTSLVEGIDRTATALTLNSPAGADL